MAVTARTIIDGALRKINVLGKGLSLDNNEAQDARETLNLMLSTWSAEGALVYTESNETFNLTGATSYTIGSGGDFDTERPLNIEAAYVSQGNTDYSLKVVDAKTYAGFDQKDITGIPEYIYNDGGFPLSNLYLYPTPPTGYTLTLYTFKPLTGLDSLTASFSMPEEYKSALIYNLACWIAPEYEMEPSLTLKNLAHDTKEAVKAQNRRNNFYESQISIPADRGVSSGNIYSGWYT